MAILLVAFFALLMFGIPVAAVMGISSTLYLLSRGADLLTIPQRMFAGADNFTLMAIPLYIFCLLYTSRIPCGRYFYGAPDGARF